MKPVDEKLFDIYNTPYYNTRYYKCDWAVSLKVYKTQIFNKWSRKEGLTDTDLLNAINEMIRGLIDADLGGGLVKKRVARPGQGKRGSYRTLLAFRKNERAFFITGFAKNERANIGPDEEVVFKKLSKIYLDANLQELEVLCKAKKLFEVNYEKT